MSQLSLKQFHLLAYLNQQDEVNSQLKMVLAPSGNLIAIYNAILIRIFNTTSKQLQISITTSTENVIFGVDETFIYVTDSFSFNKINIKNGNSSMIIEPNQEYNKISNLEYSPGHRLIYFINQSHLASYSPSRQLLNFTLLNTSTLCPIDSFFIDSASRVLVTSSYDCKLCSYQINNQNLTLLGTNTIEKCRIGGITFKNSYAYVTQESIVSKYPQIILLSLPQLNIVSYINQTSTNFSLQIINIHNYLASFGRRDDYMWLYQLSINSKPSKVVLSSQLTQMVFNQNTNEAFLLLYSNSSFFIKSFSLAFNCSIITDTVNASLEFERTCQCQSGMLFDSSTQTCQPMDCSNTIESPCKCPHHEAFDDFSLDCRLDCPSIYNTYSTIRYGNPEQCSCNYPFEWNPEVGDCSYLDCSLIDHTLPSKLSQSCICQQFYVWNDSSLTCKANSTSSTFSPDSSGPPSIGLIIALIFVGLVVIISAVIFYVKKYRRSSEDYPKQFQFPKQYEQHNPTPRPLAFENFVRSSQQLKERSLAQR